MDTSTLTQHGAEITLTLTKPQIIKDNGSRGHGHWTRNHLGQIRYHDPEGPRKNSLRHRAWLQGKTLINHHHLTTPVWQHIAVRAHVSYPKGVGRADPGNLSHTIKPIIDGLTQAGLWPDDDSQHLIGPDYRRDPNQTQPGQWAIRLVITNLDNQA